MSAFRKVVDGLFHDKHPQAKDGTKVGTGLGTGYSQFMKTETTRKPRLPFGIGGRPQKGVSRKVARDLWIESKSDAMQKRRT